MTKANFTSRASRRIVQKENGTRTALSRAGGAGSLYKERAAGPRRVAAVADQGIGVKGTIAAAVASLGAVHQMAIRLGACPPRAREGLRKGAGGYHW